jgi:cyclopropane-fatty-acyl-phospholipid synthase
MSVIDVENLRLHYARTLYHWRQRFRAAETWVRSRYGDQFYRAWNLYLAGSEATFLAGTMQLFQVVFSPVESKPPYITRTSLYREEEADEWFAVTR